MVSAPIPQDILKYKAKFVLNLTVRELVCAAVAVALGAGGYMLVVDKYFPNAEFHIKAVITMLFALPALLMGWFKPFGQPLEKVMIPFIVDNILAPSNRPNEVHFDGYDTEYNAKFTGKSSKPPKGTEYKAIR